MLINSVRTNLGAQVAMQSLGATTAQLLAAQKRVSTGLRVADAADDGPAFAVAQRVRADVGALTAANQQLGRARALVDTARDALTAISGSLVDAESLLVHIADGNISPFERDQHVGAYKALVSRVADQIDGASYGGQTLLGVFGGPAGVPVAATDRTAVRDETGAAIVIHAAAAELLPRWLAGLVGLGVQRDAAGRDTFTVNAFDTPRNAAARALRLTAGPAAFATIATRVGDALGRAAADSNGLSAAIAFNGGKIDSLAAGLGALVDADLGRESANLQALQIRQQLGAQALSLASQSPRTLLSLFKG